MILNLASCNVSVEGKIFSLILYHIVHQQTYKKHSNKITVNPTLFPYALNLRLFLFLSIYTTQSSFFVYTASTKKSRVIYPIMFVLSVLVSYSYVILVTPLPFYIFCCCFMFIYS